MAYWKHNARREHIRTRAGCVSRVQVKGFKPQYELTHCLEHPHILIIGIEDRTDNREAYHYS